MNTSLKASAYVCLLSILFVIGCQPTSEEETVDAVLVELPVSSENEEALAELNKGLAMVDAGISPDAYEHF